MADSDTEDTDKTGEVREKVQDSDAVGADTDSDGGAVLTLDSDGGEAEDA